MKTPSTPQVWIRSALNYFGAAGALACLTAGCMGPILRPQSPEAALSDAGNSAGGTQLVSAVAHPWGLDFVKIENVALVTGLAGTGEDPAPSPQRAALLSELNRREIPNPNDVLASPNTALVLVRAFLRPGIQAGDRFDVEVRTPSRSDATSLRGGWMMETRLSETAVLGGQIRKGHETAFAEGAIYVDPAATADDDPALSTQGRILSGGVATKSRSIGLVLDHKHQTIRMSTLVAKAINDRFHTYIDGSPRGVATPKTNEFVELAPMPRYRENITRYLRVVRSVAVAESPAQRIERLALLDDQLLDPVTTATAALRLEAIGGAESVEILKRGVASDDPEVRFYSAEALAYLDVTEAVAPLAKAAVDEPAFRIAALAALGSMEDGASSEALNEMLSVKSAETRYGAFRAMSTMAPDDVRIRGENLGGKVNFHVLSVSGPSMIHATNSHRSEIVMFGRDHQFRLPLVLDAGPRILVNGINGSEIRVSRFSPDEPTQQRLVSTNVEEVIRAVVDLGGHYPDVVQLLQQAKNDGALPSRFSINALPELGRTIERKPEAARDEAKLATKAD